ncbi:conserved hypothetical protein [Talaromyces stipitatus ATCC 10500]|uniref:WSC domain-containing protein n=1 Tax=Talaromyces stipitatus (strain ATCC 10500 / CBS 375.48 / QM 6759 / NRRL 1006) TaxID=441959 RepID=B8MMK2_TALSN|nr:uncharacterized protein TSTA_100020 [Talaromyces stipitatus ATCC 10500]EED13756.1 conserved hypothetical protein [Talaromyces stipitatus ATCC 10500]
MLRSTLLLIAATGVSALELGCFSGNSETLSHYINNGTFTFQSVGYCRHACNNIGHNYLALKNGTDCWCGDAVPPVTDIVNADNCDMKCAGFAVDDCGGAHDFSVYLTGPESGIQSILSSYTAAEASATVASSESATAASSESTSTSVSDSKAPTAAAAAAAVTTGASSASFAVTVPSTSTSGHMTGSGTSASTSVPTGAAAAVSVHVGLGAISGLTALALGL